MAQQRPTSATQARRVAKPRRPWVDYPRSGKRGFKRWIPSWRLVLGITTFFAILGAGTVLGFYYTTPLPTPDEKATAETSIVYFSDGVTELARVKAEDRVKLDPNQIPQHVKNAFIAAEDRTFETNRGIDLRGIARAVWANVRGKRVQGGSTITQQYVKNITRNDRKHINRKVNEAFQALRVDDTMTKDEIITAYLNTAYFGRGASSIQTAAQAYFGKNASELTTSEAAVIAGLMPSPTRWDPRKSKEKNDQRWKYVMDGLVELGKLSPQDRAAATIPETLELRDKSAPEGHYGFVLELIQDEVSKATAADGRPYDLEKGGLRVISTVDKRMQDAAYEVMQDPKVINRSKLTPGLKVGITAVDPGTGGVKALYSGDTYAKDNKRQFNTAIRGDGQGGSTFKVFGLLAALKEGYSLDSTYTASNNLKIKGLSRTIRDHVSPGPKDLRAATAYSSNSVYVQLNEDVGPTKAMELATAAGLSPDALDKSNKAQTFNWSSPLNILGSASASSWQMAEAYGMVAGGGIYRDGHVLDKIEKDGVTVFQTNTEGKRLVDEGVAADATSALRQVTQSGTGSKYASPSIVGRPVAGKTGTATENFAAWFCGFTPQISTAVGFYAEEVGENGRLRKVPVTGVNGGDEPTKVWTAFMKKAHQGMEEKDFPPEAHVGTTKGRVTAQPTDTPTETTPVTPTLPTMPTVPMTLTATTIPPGRPGGVGGVGGVGGAPGGNQQGRPGGGAKPPGAQGGQGGAPGGAPGGQVNGPNLPNPPGVPDP